MNLSEADIERRAELCEKLHELNEYELSLVASRVRSEVLLSALKDGEVSEVDEPEQFDELIEERIKQLYNTDEGIALVIKLVDRIDMLKVLAEMERVESKAVAGGELTSMEKYLFNGPLSEMMKD